MLVQQGRTPNLDFYSFYPPLGLYVNAALFGLLGRTVLAVRLFGAVLYLLVLLLVRRFFRRQFQYAEPLLPAVVFLAAAAIGNALREPGWPGFAISVLALLTYLYSPHGKWNPLWAVGASGLLTGLALLYRINFGAYVVMVVAFDLLVPWLPGGGAIRNRFCLKQDLLTAAVFLVPLSVVCATFCFWIYGRHAVATVVDLVVNAQRLMNLRGFIELPSSTELLLVISLPAGWFFLRMLLHVQRIQLMAFLPAAIAVVILLLALAGRSHLMVIFALSAAEIGTVICLHLFVYRLARPEFCLLLFYCGLLHYYLSRADFHHWRLLPIGAALLVPFLIFSSSSPTGLQHASSVARGSAIAGLLTLTFMCLVSDGTRPVATYIPKGFRLLVDLMRHPGTSDTERLLGPTPPSAEWLSVYDEDELRALRYLRAKADATDPIFVGVPDHSRLYMNNLRIYFLAGHPIGVRTFQLETRVATQPPVQQSIISDLEHNNVKWVILDAVNWRADPAFAAHPYVGSKLLDQYIASHYSEEARFGSYLILTKSAPGHGHE